jgi:argininosuccinate lyase
MAKKTGTKKTSVKKASKKKMWGGRFKAATDKLVEELNASISFDSRLYAHDIRGSIAHAAVLKKAGVLTEAERKRIVAGLNKVEKEIASGKLALTSDLEDIHMAVESRLTEIIGPLGGKLHTGRSRNDQVALDIRLFLKDEIYETVGLLHELRCTLVEVADENIDTVMPGYTHLQRAQPILLAHHLLAYFEMFGRDVDRLLDCFERVDIMPLGSGALAGSPYNLDRKLAAKLLGFSTITENSLDGVGSRDFTLEFLSVSAILMANVSRLAEELILWSSQEFGFIELSDAFTTGSSIMPQKKNPDIAELARGKTGRVYGNLVALLTTMKALPLAYNKDMQEPLFDTVDTVKGVLKVFSPMLKSMRVNTDAMERAAARGFLNATDAADYLVERGLPFREAHEVTGRIVAWCIERNRTLEEMETKEWQKFSPLFKSDIKQAISISRSLNARKVHGGTARSTVSARLKKVKAGLFSVK